MESAFQLDGIARANFFESIMQTFGCTYVCLWSYSQQSNCLVFLDGRYREENNQPGSSSGSLAQRLFNDYCQTLVPVVEYDAVPGLAFKSGLQYFEVNQSELRRLACSESQRLFYQEARIKAAIFVASKTGEIELGLSRGSQSNMEMEMRNFFQKYFTDQQSPPPDAASEIPLKVVVDSAVPPSSSSSSLRSLSVDSQSEFSSLLFNINPNTSTSTSDTSPHQQAIQAFSQLENIQLPIAQQNPNTITSTNNTSPHQQAMQAFSQLQNIQLPITQETEQAEMTRAILAVLTSSTSSSSSSQQPQQKASAFQNYNYNLLGLTPTSQIRASSSLRAQSMQKRAISFYRRLNMAMARREFMAVASRPTSTQLHHVISERKRREKLNESFQALRSLLPPGTKKDKASLLISTREYLSSLKAQIDELSRRNQILEAQVLPSSQSASVNIIDERVQIRFTPVSESTSEWRMIDVGVAVRGECSTLNLIIRILELLKRAQNLSLISVEANTQIADSAPFNHVILRLRIQGTEWEESAFEEAVRRVVADLVQ